MRTRLFEGVEALHDELEAMPRKLGMVSSKALRLTDPPAQSMGVSARAACVVSGDTTPHSSLHPAALLHAAQASGVAPARCIHVGDDLRDIRAGRDR